MKTNKKQTEKHVGLFIYYLYFFSILLFLFLQIIKDKRIKIVDGTKPDIFDLVMADLSSLRT